MTQVVEQNRLTPRAANERVTREVASWQGVTTLPGPMRGGVEFRYRNRALGHLHATLESVATADLILPPEIGSARIAEGRAGPHAYVPMPGWITAPMGTPAELANVLALFREAYDIAGAARLSA